ncbi:MAG: putative immunity protein [Chloroflexota bacterium]
MSTYYYKILEWGGIPCMGGTGVWHLPTQNIDGSWTPGEPMPTIDPVQEYGPGYHVCTEDHLLDWLLAADAQETDIEVWRVDVSGASFHGKDGNHVWADAQLICPALTDRDIRLFACDCAEHILHLYEQEHLTDMRPRTAIDVARRFAARDATTDELCAARAASAAIGACQQPDARSVAMATVRATDAGWSARAVVHHALDAVREIIDWDSFPYVFAWDAEKAWQAEKLAEYLALSTPIIRM